MFQAKKWSWKRVATNLLLVPLLVGGSVAVVHAQFGRSNNSTTMPSMPMTASSKPKTATSKSAATGDPKQFLKEGRKALAEGRFPDAQDLAMKAEANNSSGKWGLFDDTPAALRKDIQAAMQKANKTQADKLVKDAKTLAGKASANDAERAYNLDNALQMARQAEKLHGPYSAWDLSGRADKLVKELEETRSKLKVASAKPPANNTAMTKPDTTKPDANSNLLTKLPSINPFGKKPDTTKPNTNSVASNKPNQPIQQAGGSLAFPNTASGNGGGIQQAGGVDPKKTTALKLMAEGKALADKGEFAAAKAKYIEADKLGVNFSVTEPNPSFALQDLNTRGAAAMERLVRDAQGFSAQKDYAKANAALTHAGGIATTLGLYPKSVNTAKEALWKMSSGKYGTAPSSAVASNGTTKPPVNPSVKPSVPGTGTTMPPAPHTASTGTGTTMPPAPQTVSNGSGTITPPTPHVQPVPPITQVTKNDTSKPAMPTPVMPKQPVDPVAVAPVTPAPVTPKQPVDPVAVAPVTPTPAPVTPGAGNISGQKLLEQAWIEFQAGEFDTASRLAVQAHNLGMQQEAAQLMTSIDTEKLARKQRTAAASVINAKAAFDQKDYQRALGVLVLIDSKLLPNDVQRTRDEMITACRAELAKMGEGVVTTGGVQQSDKEPLPPADSPKGDPLTSNPPGTARVNPENPGSTADALRSVAMQKLRSEGLKIEEEAQKAFGRGETDLAMQMLVDYSNRVRASGLDPASISMLLRRVESRLDTFRMLKGQTDAIARQNRDKREARELITGRSLVEEERKGEVAKLMRRCNDLVKNKDYAQAERVALQAKQLEPDEVSINAMVEMIRMAKRVKEAEEAKAQREEFFRVGMNNAEYMGKIVTAQNPVSVELEATLRAGRRGSLDNVIRRPGGQAEYEIELKLDKPITVDFNQTPFEQVIENLQTLTGLPLVIDRASLDAARISTVQPITVRPGNSLAAKNVLTFATEQLGVSYIVEHEMVKITTVNKAKGRLITKVFSVADLVTPVPNFALPDHANFDKMITRNPLSSGNLIMPGLTGGAPSGGLKNGQQVSNPYPGMLATQPGIQSPQGGGRLDSVGPLSGSSSTIEANNSKHEQLMKLVTSMVRPHSWDGQGGPGKLEFYDIGNALVVNQTADVIAEVSELLEALRRLQDLAVAVEVRIVSLAESFFERMGIDFSINIKTNTTGFEPALTAPNGAQGSGVFRPQPFINDNNFEGVTVGLTPAGTFTPDLDVPIRATSFNRAIPGFGNYPNSPGNNGGISLGLAFLNDIQVFTFLEMAQGDQRSNIMQAPKLTLFNGQTSTLSVQNLEFYVTNVIVASVNGQLVFVPQNSPFPGPGDFNQGGALSITIQAVVSADRRFVRLNLPVQLSVQSGATVPLFPITTFITPVFEGGSQGQPIPFTQFLQQPAFTNLSIQTTVVCPDGGTVLLGGLKTLRESRNEFGPPFLSKIPYLNRLFKNVGVGRETNHVMIMVTPRIIINSEEEIFQTEGRLPGQGVGP